MGQHSRGGCRVPCTHCSSGLSTTLLLVPWPWLCTSRIQALGSNVWTRASRLRPPSPHGTNRPCAPATVRGRQRSSGDTLGHAHPPTSPLSPWLTRPHTDVLLSPPVREVVGAEGALGESVAWAEDCLSPLRGAAERVGGHGMRDALPSLQNWRPRSAGNQRPPTWHGLPGTCQLRGPGRVQAGPPARPAPPAPCPAPASAGTGRRGRHRAPAPLPAPGPRHPGSAPAARR